MKDHKQLHNAGFSLVEVILSMAILAIITIPLLKYFTDSMKYNMMMETEQKATVLAQNLVENLEQQPSLVGEVTDASGNKFLSIPYLYNPSTHPTYAGIGLTEKSNTFRTNSDGTGQAVFTGELESRFDVEISLDTDTTFNASEHPVIYGIDNSKDVLAIEMEQESEAVAYFMAINSAYYASHRDAGAVAYTSSQIKAALDRTMQIVLGKEGSNITVNVYYTYSCSSLPNSGISGTYDSTKLSSVKISTEDGNMLENIYLLYSTTAATDKLNVSCTTAAQGLVTSGVLNPVLNLVCQSTTGNSYRLRVKRLSITEKIKTNILLTATPSTGQVTDENGVAITGHYVESLTGTAKTVRTINMDVKVYKKGHSSTDAPLTVIKTTKGE